VRILHTGDWHVGKTLARRSRLDEAVEALREVCEIAAESRVDAVLVCGDVFDHQSPSPEAEEVVYEALVRLVERRIPVVVLAGNHDHPRRWRALEPLVGPLGVRVVAEPRRPEQGGIVEIPARDGAEVAQVAVLPWIGERRLVGAAELMGLAGGDLAAYADGMAQTLEALCAPLDPARPRILAGHLLVAGAIPGGSERAPALRDAYAVDPEALPAAVQYAALGHVHRPQRIAGAPAPARYCGSLLQLDFGEAGQRKAVVCVDVAPGATATAEEVPLAAGRPLLDVRGTLEELERMDDVVGDAHLRVHLTCERPRAGLAERVREVLPGALEVRLEAPRAAPVATPRPGEPPTPRELFGRYLAERGGTAPDEELLDLFDRVLDEVAR
jgi:exonuclease SbcD